jgi:hypothetical protein
MFRKRSHEVFLLLQEQRVTRCIRKLTGVAVIATKVNGIPAICIDKKNALLISKENPQELSCQVPESQHTKIGVSKGESEGGVPQQTDSVSDTLDSHEAAFDCKN